MFLSVRELELRPLRFEVSYPVSQFTFDMPGRKDGVRLGEPVAVNGSAELESSVGDIRVRGHIKTTLETECVKCLETAAISVDSDFDLVYLPEGVEAESGEIEISDKDAEIGFYQGHGLELDNVVEEFLILAVPMRPVCKENCQGLCPNCGVNLNDKKCECPPVDLDPRWTGLQALKGPILKP